MKNEDIDRLFRQKLEQLEAQPTTQAWKQLEEQLQHKKKKTKWGYLSGIAAGLLLLLGIWGSLEYSSSMIPASPVATDEEKRDVHTPDMQQETPVRAEQAPATASKKENTPEQPAPSPAIAERAREKGKSSQKDTGQEQKALTQKPAKKMLQKNTSAETEKQIQVAELPAIESKDELIQHQAGVGAGAEVNITAPSFPNEQVIISYKSDGDKDQPAMASVELPEDREISVRKVVGFFKKVKENSGGGLAELREAKDDLLSLRLSRTN